MYFDLRLRNVFDDLLDDLAGVDQRSLALGTDFRRDIVMLDGLLINRRFGPRCAGMFSLVGLPPILRGLLSRRRIGLGPKALLAADQLPLQLRHLGLQLGVLGTKCGDLGVLGTQGSHLGQ